MEKRTRLVDICIVCALYEEADAVLNEFSARCKVSFAKEFSGADLYEYRYTTIQNNRDEPLTILVTWLADNGPVRTGLHLKPFLQEFQPRFAAMTGICAGYKEKDVKLGDLIIAEYAYHYEIGKDTIGKDGQKKHELQTITYGVTPQVLQYARSFQDWREPVAKLKRPKTRQENIQGSEPLKEEAPTCYIAPMASGMPVKEDESFPWLREYINRKTLALEMEAATFYLTLQEVSSLGIHSLVVKGVSDYADGSKNDEYHTYAERASAIYLLYFIREYVTSTTMPRRSSPPVTIRRAAPTQSMADNAGQQEQTGSHQKKTISITFTILIWGGILLTVFGAVVAVFGMGNTTFFEGRVGNFEFKTMNVGLVILAVGAFWAGFSATHLPPNVRVLARKPRSLTEKIADRAIYFFLLGGIGCVLLSLSLFFK